MDMASGVLNGTATTLLHMDADGPTVQLLCSKFIGYTVLVMSSLFVKLPQMVKIAREQDANGISYISELLLLLVSCNSLSYNIMRSYPISTWGETLAISVQELITGWYILTLTRRSSMAVGHVVLIPLYVCVLLSPAVPESVHVFLQLLAIPMVSSSKLLQIRTNWVRQSTGQLSRASCIAMILRTSGRLATSVMETGDVYLILRYAIFTFLNIVIFCQILFYGVQRRVLAEPKSK